MDSESPFIFTEYFPNYEQWKESNLRALLFHVERTLQNATHLQRLPAFQVCVLFFAHADCGPKCTTHYFSTITRAKVS